MTTIHQRQQRAACVVFLCVVLLIPILRTNGQTQPLVAPPSKSDTYAVDQNGKKSRVQHREIAGTNFRISGVGLSKDEDVLLQAAKLFGETVTVNSGDGADSNAERCYRSATDSDNTHLVFGRGEVDSSFILSSDGSIWKKDHACKPSEKIDHSVATDSGLHLGLTQQQVVAILGLATRHTQNLAQHRDELIYSLQAEKQTDPQKLAQWWQRETKNNPAVNRQVFLENYKSYALEVYVDARFVDDLLTRLTVSWSAQY